MITLNRWSMVVPAVLFASYHAVLGLLALSAYENQVPVLWAISIYLIGCVLSLALYSPLKMPLTQALVNLAIAVTTPLLVNSVLNETTGYLHDTWYVEAVATLLAITAVRGHNWVALAGYLALSVEVIAWGGIQTIFTSGLIGAALLIFAGTAASVGFLALNSEIDRNEKRQRKLERETVALQVASAERTKLMRETLSPVMPLLGQLASGKPLSPEQTRETEHLTESLRDRLAGRKLVDDRVAKAVSVARDRGLEVVFVAGNHLDELEDGALELLRQRLVEELERVDYGRVIIRTLIDHDNRVSFVVTQSGDPKPLYQVRF